MDCPECGSVEVRQDDEDSRSDGYGITSWSSIDYTCEKCGCQFTENYETKRTVKIRKKGEVEEGKI
jgi:transcriptional regulator NrdR family protein